MTEWVGFRFRIWLSRPNSLSMKPPSFHINRFSRAPLNLRMCFLTRKITILWRKTSAVPNVSRNASKTNFAHRRKKERNEDQSCNYSWTLGAISGSGENCDYLTEKQFIPALPPASGLAEPYCQYGLTLLTTTCCRKILSKFPPQPEITSKLHPISRLGCNERRILSRFKKLAIRVAFLSFL